MDKKYATILLEYFQLLARLGQAPLKVSKDMLVMCYLDKLLNSDIQLTPEETLKVNSIIDCLKQNCLI